MKTTPKEKTLFVQFTSRSTGNYLNSTVVYMPPSFGSAKENTPEEENEFEMVRYAVEKKTGVEVLAFSSRDVEKLEGAKKFMYEKHCAGDVMKSSLGIFETSVLMEEYALMKLKAHASQPVELPERYHIYIGEDRPTGRSLDGDPIIKWESEHDGKWMKSEDVIHTFSKLQADNEAFAKNLKGGAALTGATYSTIITQRDNLKLEFESQREVIRSSVKAWEALQGGRNHSAKDIERWLMNSMKPAIDAMRRMLDNQ